METWKDTGNGTMITVIFIKENSTIGRNKVKGFISMQVEIFMKENGKRT